MLRALAVLLPSVQPLNCCLMLPAVGWRKLHSLSLTSCSPSPSLVLLQRLAKDEVQRGNDKFDG